MRLLLDSQAFILLLQRPDSLGLVARDAMVDPNNEIFLSVVTPIELQIKVSLKKLKSTKISIACEYGVQGAVYCRFAQDR